MNTKAALFPTIFAIIMAIASIGLPMPGTASGSPWMTAVHSQIMPDGQKAAVDNIAFFLWGHQYTVVGTKMIQSKFVFYDWRDFPFYSMVVVIIAILTGIMAILSNRKYSLIIRGREMKIGLSYHPVKLLVISAVLMFFAALYLDYSARTTVIPLLHLNNYSVETSYGFQFMGMGILGFLGAIAMTHINTVLKKREETEVV